jgi:hypothetical protein
MSVVGYKQTFQGVTQNVRFTPKSGHQQWNACFGAVWPFNTELGHENSESTLTLPPPPRRPSGA